MVKKKPRKTKKTKKGAKKKAPKKSAPKKRIARARRDVSELDFSAHFHPEPGVGERRARRMLEAGGFEPRGTTAGGAIVVRASRRLVEERVGVPLRERRVLRGINRVRGRMTRRSYTGRRSDEPPPLEKEGLGCFVFPTPFEYWQAPSAYPPRVSYYHLHPPRDLPRLFGVESLHARGIRGQGIRIVMVDSGFFRHPYYGDPGLHGGAAPSITTHGVLAPTSDPETDGVGHGTGIAANVLAIAPGCDFHHVKDDDDPLAALVLARALSPAVITCSWGWRENAVANLFENFPESGDTLYLREVEAEIRAAVEDGVTVLFASGNGPAPGAWPSSAPGVISVGGALVDENLALTVSSYATSFASLVTPGRLCPDVCGIVGPAPSGLLFALPTQPDNEFDGEFSAVDGTSPGDGWLVASGTSSATPQLAGMAALLMQMHDGLTPAEVLDRFREMAVGVHQGESASGHPATASRPNLATGHGLVTFRRPQRANGYTGL